MKNKSQRAAERRRHKRFIVSGTARIESAVPHRSGRVVSVSAGGLLVLSDLNFPVAAVIRVAFSIEGFVEEFSFTALGRVVWTAPGKLGVEFVDPPPGNGQALLDVIEFSRMILVNRDLPDKAGSFRSAKFDCVDTRGTERIENVF